MIMQWNVPKKDEGVKDPGRQKPPEEAPKKGHSGL
jgi:hypothetical protein